MVDFDSSTSFQGNMIRYCLLGIAKYETRIYWLIPSTIHYFPISTQAEFTSMNSVRNQFFRPPIKDLTPFFSAAPKHLPFNTDRYHRKLSYRFSLPLSLIFTLLFFPFLCLIHRFFNVIDISLRILDPDLSSTREQSAGILQHQWGEPTLRLHRHDAGIGNRTHVPLGERRV